MFGGLVTVYYAVILIQILAQILQIFSRLFISLTAESLVSTYKLLSIVHCAGGVGGQRAVPVQGGLRGLAHQEHQDQAQAHR